MFFSPDGWKLQTNLAAYDLLKIIMLLLSWVTSTSCADWFNGTKSYGMKRFYYGLFFILKLHLDT